MKRPTHEDSWDTILEYWQKSEPKSPQAHWGLAAFQIKSAVESIEQQKRLAQL